MKNQNEPISMTQISLPQGGGTIRGMGETFQSNEFTGTASLSISLPTSPCRDFEPHLSLDYSSGAGNGVYGLGFDLSIPTIARKTSKGLPQYNGLDTFLLSQAGDLVPVPGSQRVETLNTDSYTVVLYRPRLEGTFAKIEHWTQTQDNTSHWRVVSGDNVTSLFGTSPQTRIADPLQPAHIFSWLLAETFDARGNHALFEYVAENRDNVPATLSEVGRLQTANKYIHRIAYGNAEPFQEGQTTPETWHFEVLFDYGEYNTAPTHATPYLPTGTWLARPDAFSTYQAGFEIRTHRLCRQVLLFHTFAELGNDPVLVHATRLQYQSSPVVSLLQTVESVGYRFENAHYTTKSLPPLEFGYVPFQPVGHQFEPLTGDGGQFLAGLDFPPIYQLVDLYGEGIPGILYSDGQTVSYREPDLLNGAQGTTQTVQYALPQSPLSLPIEANRELINLQLMDLTGDGLLELVVSTGLSEGYYKVSPDHSWEPFRPLPAAPIDHSHPDTFRVDVTGDGLADMLMLETGRTCVYPSRGADGFGSELIGISQSAVPLSRQGAQNEYLGFADMFGSGMQHLVRVTNGRVECWPSLGYGRFGLPILLENAPYFGADLDASRLFFADLDGSGTADLIYAYPDHVEIFFNQSGNIFSDPLALPLPALWDRMNQLQFADIYGNGASCLVFSENHAQPRHWCYDFTQGQKPYLLATLDNHLGAQSTITYRSSVSYYLADKQKGLSWIVNLPFPVQVVARTDNLDQVSQTRLVSTYAYHHGYYDGVEREFRGFGMVERQDAETLQADSQPTDVPPVLTKTWYHTGAWREDQVLSRQYANEYYQDDPQAYSLPDSVYAVETNDARSWREAFYALQGQVLRTEVYAPTAPVMQPDQQQDAPYSVSETNYHIALLQPATPDQYGVYFVHPLETLTYQYERNPLDPRTHHGFVLSVDEFGNVLLSCGVTYGRRVGTANPQPEQLALHITASEQSVINQIDSASYLLGLPLETKTYEVTGLTLPAGQQYFTFAQVSAYLTSAANISAARLLGWQSSHYLSPEDAPDQVTPQALRVSVRAVEMAAEQTAQAFAGVLSSAELATLLAGEGGYQSDAEQTYWWNPGLSRSYLDATSFFLPTTMTDPYGNVTTYAYDAALMLLSSVTDPLGNQVAADFDYQTLSPRSIRDINGNISEVLFDPLGMVIVTSHYGTENGQSVGFMQLSDYQPQSASSMDEIITSPQRYLQGAGSYFYYDPFSWSEQQVPVHALSLVATQYPSAEQSPIQISLGYGDGFGRAQQTSMLVEPGEAHIIHPDGTITVEPTTQRWLTSGRTVYNNKGNPVKQYEPYYIDTYNYIDIPQLNTFGVSPTLFYDPLGRLVRMDTAKGFFTKTEFTAWMQAYYDENDTVKDSSYYQDNITNLDPAFQNERVALQRAALCYNTPTTSVLDNLGRTILSIQQQEGIVAEDAFVSSGLTSVQSQTLWQDLQTGGWLDFRGALTSAFQPDQPNFSLNLSATFAADEPQIIAVLQEIQTTGTLLTTRSTWDIQGNLLTSADPRLSVSGNVNFQMSYTLTGVALRTISADAGTRWLLLNVMGNAFYQRDARGFEVTITYDALHRPVQSYVTGGDGATPLDQIAERMIYGDSLDVQGQAVVPDPAQANLRGKLYRYYDYAGVMTTPSYTLLGKPLSSSRQLLHDYKQEANWNDISDETLTKLLETPPYTESIQYDALGRVTAATNFDGNVSEPGYLLSGRLGQMQVRPQAGAQAESYVQSIAYDAKGQRESILYGSGVTTDYTYEPTTFRLITLESTRASDAQKLQDLTYTYDPVGNITHLVDGAQEPVFNANQLVKPESAYIYDALYQLIQATGREHPSLSPQENEQRGDYDSSWMLPVSQPINNGQALQNYTQQMNYDVAGNLYAVQHLGANPWTRLLTVSDTTNRAVDSTLTTVSTNVNTYFDGSGNQKSLSGFPALAWNQRENLASVTVIARQDTPSDCEYYVYDGGGQRVRKVYEQYGAGGASVHVEETIYLGTLEIKRISQMGNLVEERHALRVMDDQQMMAQRITWVVGDPPVGVASPQLRYQLANKLGSAMMEVDEQGQIISYEEYFPYGGTSLIAGRNVSEVELKQYRYSGKERDTTTGLYYYGARYYAPWLGRWMSPDPAGTVGGFNLYAFVRGNPITLWDMEGKAPTKDLKQLIWNFEAEAALNYMMGRWEKFTKNKPKELGDELLIIPNIIYQRCMASNIGDRSDDRRNTTINWLENNTQAIADLVTVSVGWNAIEMFLNELGKLHNGIRTHSSTDASDRWLSKLMSLYSTQVSIEQTNDSNASNISGPQNIHDTSTTVNEQESTTTSSESSKPEEHSLTHTGLAVNNPGTITETTVTGYSITNANSVLTETVVQEELLSNNPENILRPAESSETTTTTSALFQGDTPTLEGPTSSSTLPEPENALMSNKRPIENEKAYSPQKKRKPYN